MSILSEALITAPYRKNTQKLTAKFNFPGMLSFPGQFVSSNFPSGDVTSFYVCTVMRHYVSRLLEFQMQQSIFSL